tara:strand:+ start:61 stop:321 length:261 start_codon:yes stop_codon:yes gene_type:complete
VPRYKYICTECQHTRIIFHRIDEICEETCRACECLEPLQKLISTCFIKTVDKKPEKEKVGSITIEHIEENRQILEKQKKEAKEKEL